MMKNKNTVIVPDGEEFRNRSETPDSCCRFGVSEREFPREDRCFRKNVSVLDAEFEALCPHCSVWTSLPDGATLKVTHIFDCGVCGYGKRRTKI